MPILALLCVLAQGFATTLPPDARRSLTRISGPDRVEMVTHVYTPPGPGPFPVVIFLHGRASEAGDRNSMLSPVLPGHAHYWLDKGFAVVAPIREGYGATGGVDVENTGASQHGFCSSPPDYHRAVAASTAAVARTLKWLAQQPWADARRVILEGQSAGGLAAIAACAQQFPGVVGCINFSGGTGGNNKASPDHTCEPEALGAVYRELGATTTTPSLWLYAKNDHFWGEAAPREWFKEFQRGPGRGTFIETGPVSTGEGHDLLRHGGRLWVHPLSDFLHRIGF